jgi:hypothetical protein
MRSLYRWLIVIAGLAVTTPTFAMRYIPFAGTEGYQEIEVASGVYFVAFQGTSANTADEIRAGWATRSAELCLANGFGSFVELSYLFEPVFKEDKPLSRIEPENLGAWPMHAKGMIYVPIIVPHRNGAATYEMPGKMAHVRCVKDAAALVDPQRAVDAEKVIATAKARGWITQKAK